MTPDNDTDTDTDTDTGTEPRMTAPIFEPDSTTAPAKPRRNRLWAVAAVLLAAALAGGAALYAATRSSGDGPDAAPADPSPAASSDPAPTLTPSDTPTAAAPAPATPEEAARAELLALPGRQAVAADKAFLDQTGDPNNYFDPVSAGPLYQDWMKRVLAARADGDVYQQSTTTIHSSEVVTLDLAAGTATVQACQTLTASGINGDGSPGSLNEPRSLMIYTAERGSDGLWRLIGRDAAGSC